MKVSYAPKCPFAAAMCSAVLPLCSSTAEARTSCGLAPVDCAVEERVEKSSSVSLARAQ